MTDKYKTEQEAFWAGEFGDVYCQRNASKHLVAANLALFSTILRGTRSISSIIEFGSNIGLNLIALRSLLPDASLSAIEINPTAIQALRQLENVTVHPGSILEFIPERTYDLALIKGVLIHIDPSCLPDVYERLHASSARYICLVEYYNPTPMEIEYRGHRNRLYKRDFAGEMLDRFPDLSLVDYGFVYRRDAHFAQDDATWFLLEKQQTRDLVG